ncbi:MAG: hypothetical protein ABIP20_08925 [Chthoniobacteraceae bacterium]
MEPAEIARRAKVAAGGIRDLGKRIADNPVSAVLTALAAGFVCGLVLRLFERPERVREEK